ncbi:MAG: phosphoglycerate dehydrogenase [Flavobacteriales bacterium]|nr:MAG: phosphoglycerate dehydrogenase [Flavobacteriales bacterium]
MPIPQKHYIFDFDSTLTRLEALEELAEISLKDHPKQQQIIEKIKTITDKGIDGTLPFNESLEQRIKLLEANKVHLEQLVKRLKRKISKSISRNKQFFKKHADEIYVISCGFKEFIAPIVQAYNIPDERIYANTFRFNRKGKIIGYDDENVLSKHNGKIDCLKQMNLPGEVHVIGDGYSDYVMKEAGIADKFFLYTENVERENVVKKADHVTPSLDEFLYVNKLPMSISYPKNRIKVLMAGDVHTDAFENLDSEGYTIDKLQSHASEEELQQKIQDASILAVGSETVIDSVFLAKAKRLLTIGVFSMETNNIDLNACLNKGITVFNAPFSNTRSVVELAIGEMIMLLRKTFDQSRELHRGIWNKSTQKSREIRGKKLGIVGYGNIGKQLSVLAESLGMQVYYYDFVEKLALGNATKLNSLSQLLKKADIVSVHVGSFAENRSLFGEKEFRQMKNGAYFLNLSGGEVVDMKALAKSLKTGKLAGAAVDVYPLEPNSNKTLFESELQGLSNVILSPHIAGVTEESQKDIADFVPRRIIEYINTGNSYDSVNFPNIRLPEQVSAHRFLHIHHNMPGILAKVNSVLAKFDLNIVGQYLKTNEQIGYLITDVNKDYNKKVIDELKKIEHTIKFRVLY